MHGSAKSAAVDVHVLCGLGAVASYCEARTSCHKPPFRLRLLPPR
jgi:hypothetical protein